MKKILIIVLAVILALSLSLTSLTFASGGDKEVIPVQMVLDASLSEVSTAFDTPRANLEVAESREFSFGDDKFLLSSIVDKKSKQAYMVSTDAQGKVWIAKPKIEGELVDYMSQMEPEETVTVSIWAIIVSPEEELRQIPSKYPDVPFEGYSLALGVDVSPEVLDAIEADITEIKLRAIKEAVQPVVDLLQSTENKILYVSKYAPTVRAELNKNDIYKLARLPEVKRISLPNEPEPCMDVAAKTIRADNVWAEGYDGGKSEGSGVAVAVGYNGYGQCDVDDWMNIVQVAAGGWHTVGLESNGAVVAVGLNNYGQCDVDDWMNIVQVAAGWYHTVGLEPDGTVVDVGYNGYGQRNVGDWTDIIQVAAGLYHTVGLKSDGTVVAVGNNYFGQCNVGDWTDIIQVGAGEFNTVGLKSDGTVVCVGNNDYGQCNVGSWANIIQVAEAGGWHTVGLKSNGNVVAVGWDYYGQCNVGSWANIIQVAAGHSLTVGLKSNGNVVAVGQNNYGQRDVDDWMNIVQVAAGCYHTVGVKSDGTQTKVAVIDKGIDFDHWAIDHADGGTRPDSEVLDDHGTKVAGCIASRGIYDDRLIRGIAYGTKLLDANMWWYGDYVSACDWAHDNDADVYSCSYGWSRYGSWDNDECEYFDQIASYWDRLPVCAAGNKDIFTAYVASPANAWNVLAVGGIDDKDTLDLADDEIWDGIIFGSCWKNPKTPHGDREKPEVCAPAKDITTTTLEDGFDEVDGTSFAAPQVAGIAALLIEQNLTLREKPALLKAIIMASAIHNVEPNYPDRPMDDEEGVGTVDAYAAYTCLNPPDPDHDPDWIWDGEKLEGDLPFVIPFYAEAGETVRFVISWLAHTTYEGWTDYELCADLGLDIYMGTYWFAGSNSYDSAWEIVQFTAPYSGTYHAEISAYNHGGGDPWTYNGEEYIAAAWYRWKAEDFEWGEDGDPLSDSGGGITWEYNTYGSTVCEIDDDVECFGTRCARLYDGGTGNPSNAWARFDQTAITSSQCIEFCLYKPNAAYFAFTHGNGSYYLRITISSNEHIYYYDGTHHDTGATIAVDTWTHFAIKDVDWDNHTFDIYQNGIKIWNDAAMASGSGSYNVVVFNQAADYQECWIDDVVIRGG